MKIIARRRHLGSLMASTFLMAATAVAACVGDSPEGSLPPATDGGGTPPVTDGWSSGSNPSSSSGGSGDTDAAAEAATRAVPMSVAGGYDHACAVMSDQSVWCWGANEKGQLGVPVGPDQPVPVRVPGVTSAAAVTAGVGHTCVLLVDGQVVCFGDNERGQLGIPLETTGPNTSTPSLVVGLSGPVLKVSAGTNHTCVVLKNLTAQCFGAPVYPCIAGLPGAQSAPAPTPRSPGDGPFIDVQAHDTHTCFLTSPDRKLRCMGVNNWGELGYPRVDGQYDCRALSANPSPQHLDTLALGAVHTCGLDGDKVSCVGQTLSGSIGKPVLNPDGVGSLRRVADWTGVSLVVAGYRHTCARMADGTVSCMGSNITAQLGRPGAGTADNPEPAPVVGLGPVAALATGHFFTCAITEGVSPQVRCWGQNDHGQLGAGVVGGDNPVVQTVQLP